MQRKADLIRKMLVVLVPIALSGALAWGISVEARIARGDAVQEGQRDALHAIQTDVRAIKDELFRQAREGCR